MGVGGQGVRRDWPLTMRRAHAGVVDGTCQGRGRGWKWGGGATADGGGGFPLIGTEEVKPFLTRFTLRAIIVNEIRFDFSKPSSSSINVLVTMPKIEILLRKYIT